MELTRIQREAVDKILSYYSTHNKTKVDFKAPTGSGKTLMASWVISSLLERNLEENFIFVVASPSSSSLPFFFEQKINIYKKDLPYSKFEVEYIESPSAAKSDKTEATVKLKVESNKVYIFGKATFGSGRIFTERNIINDFVDEIIDLGYKLIYIRDEAHIGDIVRVDNDSRKFEDLMQSNAHFIIKMTATPNFADPEVNIVIVKESDINNGILNEDKWLLKTNPVVLLNQTMTEEELLDTAILKFKEVKEEYIRLEKESIFIHPAMLIQVSNEPSNKDDKKIFFDGLQEIKNKLDYYGLSWVQYFGDNDKESNTVYKDKFTLDDLTKINNPIDVVIFKVGPSTGWDIPRACMLLQLRKVCSDKLNIQTIGRIKRNPYPNLERNIITDNYYIFSNAPELNEDLNFYRYEMKPDLKNEVFPVIEISNKRDFKISIQKESIKNDVIQYIISNKYTIIQDLKKYFTNEKDVDIFRKELYEVNGAVVYSAICSPFIFLKELRRLLESRNNVFELCKDGISVAFEKEFSKKVLYGEIHFQIEHLQYLLFHSYTKELMNIIKKNSPFKSKYKVTMVPYEPKQYVEIYEDVKGEGLIEYNDKSYLFNITKNNSQERIQPLDSPNSEPVVFNFLSKEINAMNKYRGNVVKIWAKNLRSSNISGDYLDRNHTFHKSFFDFIIKFINGNYLYIEVKGKNDIDPEKTKLLKESYADYFKNREVNLFTHPIVISVWVVDGRNITHETFYDKELIKEDLNALTYDELFMKIAL